jgi:hypothetical protein
MNQLGIVGVNTLELSLIYMSVEHFYQILMIPPCINVVQWTLLFLGVRPLSGSLLCHRQLQYHLPRIQKLYAIQHLHHWRNLHLLTSPAPSKQT